MTTPLRLAIIGTAKRSSYLYGPLIQALPQEVKLVSVWGRSPESARRLGESLGVPWYTDLDRLVRETAPEIGHRLRQLQRQRPGRPDGGGARAATCCWKRPSPTSWARPTASSPPPAQRGLKIEVAEQFHRRPLEQIKLKLIASGLFGRVYTAFNDFAGHGYHGVSVMRSYLGFDARPLQVTGSVQNNALAPHWSRLAGTRTARAPRRRSTA